MENVDRISEFSYKNRIYTITRNVTEIEWKSKEGLYNKLNSNMDYRVYDY